MLGKEVRVSGSSAKAADWKMARRDHACRFAGEVGDGGLHAVEFTQDASGAVDDDESGAGELYAPPMRCSKGGAGFFSRVAICWEIGGGVRLSASAAAMTVPRSWISRSICMRRMS